MSYTLARIFSFEATAMSIALMQVPREQQVTKLCHMARMDDRYFGTIRIGEGHYHQPAL
jgi:hypothetical protein